jgi:hypothetical protein
MCFVFVRELATISAPYSINYSAFITELKSVYSAVRTGTLNKAVCASSFKGLSNSLFKLKTKDLIMC